MTALRAAVVGSMADQNTGLVLIVLGVVLMAAGVFFLPICGVGIVLLIIGIVMMAEAPRMPAYAPMYPYQYPAPVAPTAPPGTAPAAPGAYTPPACPVCGSPLTWVAQYSRWYCTRCMAYR